MRIGRGRHGRRPAVAVAVALVVGLLAGCGGDDEPRTGGPDSSETSTTPEATQTPSSGEPTPGAATGPTGSAAASPSVPPADGPTLRTADGVSIRVPRGFDGDAGGSPDLPRVSERQGDLSEITFSTRRQVGEPDFEMFKEIALESTPSGVRLRALPDRELLGQPAYHFAGRVDEYQRSDQFGVVTPDGVVVSLDFWTLATYSQAERAAIIEPVLASIQVG